MRILDVNNDKVLNEVLLLLTSQEAGELRDTIDQILSQGTLEHEHILDMENIDRQNGEVLQFFCGISFWLVNEEKSALPRGN